MFSLIKGLVFSTFYFSGLAHLSLFFLNLSKGGQYIRVVNFHCVSPQEKDSFKKLLIRLSKIFHIATFDEFEKFHNGKLNLPKPSLLLTFDDGLKSHKEVVANVLDELNFQGCFFIPTKAVVENQNIKASEMDILIHGNDSGDLLNREEIRELGQKHIIGSHTISHIRMREGLDDKTYRFEVGQSKKVLEEILEKPVTVFCWVGGEIDSYSYGALTEIKSAGYKYSFMTNNQVVTPKQNPLAIQRTNIEVFWNWKSVFISLSGLYDFLYIKKKVHLQDKLKMRLA